MSGIIGKFQRGAILHEVLVGALRAKGDTFHAWCLRHGVNPNVARNATFGQSRGPAGTEIVERMVQAADPDFVERAYRNSHGPNNVYLTHVIEVSDLPGVTLERLIIDGEYSEIGTTPHEDFGYPIEAKTVGVDRAWIRFVDGTHSAADAHLVATYGEDADRPWTADHILTGVAHAILTFSWLDRAFKNGMPQVRFELGGIPLYDPRLDGSVGGSGAQRWSNPATWAPSTNPVVIIYNILRGITLPCGSVWGGDAAAADLPLDSWAAAMNACDLGVGSPPRPQFRAGFEIRFDEEPADVIEELLAAANAQIGELGGVWRVQAGAPAAAALAITDEDILVSRPQHYDPFPGLEATYNAISVSAPSPNALWNATGIETLTNPAWEAEDGGRRLFELKLPAVPWAEQARQLAQNMIRDERRFRRHGVDMPPEYLVLEPLDTIAWSSDWNGYSAKLFEITEAAYNLRTLTVAWSLRERDPDDFVHDPGLELPDPPRVVRPVGEIDGGLPGFGALAIVLRDGADAPRRPAIRALWDAAIADTAATIVFELRVAGQTDLAWTGGTADLAGGAFVIAAVLPATAYELRASARAPGRSWSWTVWRSVTTPDIRLAEAGLADTVWDAIDQDIATLIGDFEAGTFLPALADIDIEIERLDRTIELRTIDQRDISDALGVISEHVLWAMTRISDTESTIRDATIYTDPGTGEVRIAALEGQATEISEVGIRLSAAEASIELRATYAEVNKAISNAVLDPTQIPIIGDLELRVSDVEVDVDALNGLVSLKADTTTVSGMNVRLTTAEADIDSLESAITLKVNQTEFDAVETRVQTAEVAIEAMDGPSITQTVADTRHLVEAGAAASAETLRQLLGNYEAREAISRDIAYATQDMRALVDEDRAAMASMSSALGARIDGATALIETERTVRASETEALAEDITTLQADMTDAEGDIAANATATTGLTIRVSSAESGLISQANDITSLTTTVGGHSTTITEHTQSLNGISAEWALRIDNNGVVSGAILRSNMDDQGANTTAAAWLVDKFAIVAPGGSFVPFVVYSTPTVINGVAVQPGVYIKSAIIHEAQIDTLHLAGRAVTVPAYHYEAGPRAISETRATLNTLVMDRAAGVTTKLEFAARITGDSAVASVHLILSRQIGGGAKADILTLPVGLIARGQVVSFPIEDTDTAGGSTTYRVEAVQVGSLGPGNTAPAAAHISLHATQFKR